MKRGTSVCLLANGYSSLLFFWYVSNISHNFDSWLPMGSNHTLQRRHNGQDVVSNNQPHQVSNKISKLRVTGLCERNPPVTGGFPWQRDSNAENVSIWWRHHVCMIRLILPSTTHIRVKATSIFITRDSEVIMFSPCVFVCVCVFMSVYVCHDVCPDDLTIKDLRHTNHILQVHCWGCLVVQVRFHALMTLLMTSQGHKAGQILYLVYLRQYLS